MRPALTLPALNRLVGLITAVGVIGVATVAQGQPHPYNPYWADGFNSGTYQPRDALSEKWLEAPNFRREALEETYEPDYVPKMNAPAMRAPDPGPWELSGDRLLPPGSPLSTEPARVPRDPYWAADYWRDDYWVDDDPPTAEMTEDYFTDE